MVDSRLFARRERWEEEKNRLTDEAIEDVNKHGGIPHDEVVAYMRSAGKPIPKPQPRILGGHDG